MHHSLLIAAAAALAAIPSWATTQTGQTGKPGQTGQPGTTQQPGATDKRPMPHSGLMLHTTQQLMAMQVTGSDGTSIGRIQDLVLRPNGSIAYAIVSSGTGEVALPWHLLDMKHEGGVVGHGDTLSRAPGGFKASIDAAKVKGAPRFDASKWPKDSSPSFFGEVDRYYGPDTRVDRGTSPGLSATAAFLVRASQVKGATVVSASDAGTNPRPGDIGKDPEKPGDKPDASRPVTTSTAGFGRINELVVDPMEDRVNYVVVALNPTSTTTPGGTGGTGGAGGTGTPGAGRDESPTRGLARTIAVPWETLRLTNVDNNLRVAVSMPLDKLSAAPQFQAGETSWREMSDPVFVGRVYQYYEVRPYWVIVDDKGGRTPMPPPDKKDDKPDKPDDDEPKRP